MNLEKIFTLFYIPDGDSTSTPLYESNPSIFYTLMFEKILLNEDYMKSSLYKVYNPQKSTDLNLDSSFSDIIHARSWSYIEKVKIREKNYKAYFKKRDKNVLIQLLEKEINFYLDKEEYEKCAVLHKIRNFFLSF